MMPGLRQLILIAALAAPLAGCERWPNFDYAPLDDVYIDEREVSGVVAQNLGTVVARTIISGSVDSTGIADSGSGSQFSFDGEWYTGDVDYYALDLRAPSDVDVSLTWPASNTTIDVFMFRYNPESRRLEVPLGSAVDEGGAAASFTAEELDPEVQYIVVVGGRAGPSSAYTLTLAPIPLEDP